MLPMNFQEKLEAVKQFVLARTNKEQEAVLIYHNTKHTTEVVKHATQIANHYQLSDEDFFVVISAAWFHDTGYPAGKANHETQGAALAADFLKQQGISDAVIEKVKACILATKMPQNPHTLVEQILCDADLYHLGTDDFSEYSKLLRKEIETTEHIEIDKHHWREKNIELLSSHQYFTDYARLLLSDQQEKNLNKLKKKEESDTEEQAIAPVVSATVPLQPEAPAKDKKGKKDKPDKGIETMFRITSGNNQRLSDMADRKAHILITVNSIILSAIISLVLKKLDENNFLAIPTFMLLGISLGSMIFSILSTRPNIPAGTFSQQDVDNKTVNLLFFGNFYKMGLDVYTAGMQRVMDDKDFLYGTLIKDVYSQGVVLGRKYHLLRIAYNVFMYGLIVAVVAFVIASIIHDKTPPVPVPHISGSK